MTTMVMANQAMTMSALSLLSSKSRERPDSQCGPCISTGSTLRLGQIGRNDEEIYSILHMRFDRLFQNATRIQSDMLLSNPHLTS